MARVYFITHPEVQIDPNVPIPDWPLSPRGRQRMQTLLAQPWVASLGAVWSSTERKAVEAAELLAIAIKLWPRQLPELGENDRSATGYLQRTEFEATADAFFAHPTESVRGWEKALDAQRRIVDATRRVLAQSPAGGDIAIISHGGVGTLLLCWLKTCPISRERDQPGTGGGNYFCFQRETYGLDQGWQPIDRVETP